MSFPLLAIDTSTAFGTVALFVSNSVVLSREVEMGASKQDAVTPAISSLCAEAKIAPSEIRSVLCGSGPGSFTSLRISAAIVKGLCHANGAALYATSSLLLAAASINEAGSYLVHSDAMRGERFAQQVIVSDDSTVTSHGGVLRVASGDIGDLATKLDITSGTVAVGVIPHLSGDAVVRPDASKVLRLAGWHSEPVSLSQWEPSYGRDAEAQVQWEQLHGVPLPRLG